MKVIVASMPKTGTKSLEQALTMLGYNVDGFMDQFERHMDEWDQILTSGFTKEQFQAMYANVDAVTGSPAFGMWQEISEAFPEAKIILTVRESDEVWLQSYLHLITSLWENWYSWIVNIISPTNRKFSRILFMAVGKYSGHYHYPVWSLGGLRQPRNDMMMKQWYRKHNAHVIHSAPKEKLLVLDMSRGWEPLCKFLNKPVPSEPFPHLNKKNAMWKTSRFTQHPFKARLQTEARITLGITSIAAIFFFYRLVKMKNHCIYDLLKTNVEKVFSTFS